MDTDLFDSPVPQAYNPAQLGLFVWPKAPEPARPNYTREECRQLEAARTSFDPSDPFGLGR